MRLLLALAVVVFALLLAGCGGGSEDPVVQEVATTTPEGETTVETRTVATPSEGPGEFMEELLSQFVRGQYGRGWDTLHPVHQELVSRGRFEECSSLEAEDVGSFELAGFSVLETYEDPIDVEGIPERTSTAVTYEATFRLGEQESPLTDTGHLVVVDGDWRWILAPDDVRAYEAGDCPSEAG